MDNRYLYSAARVTFAIYFCGHRTLRNRNSIIECMRERCMNIFGGVWILGHIRIKNAFAMDLYMYKMYMQQCRLYFPPRMPCGDIQTRSIYRPNLLDDVILRIHNSLQYRRRGKKRKYHFHVFICSIYVAFCTPENRIKLPQAKSILPKQARQICTRLATTTHSRRMKGAFGRIHTNHLINK